MTAESDMEYQKADHTGSERSADPTSVRQAIRRHGERITQDELQRAFSRLESHGTLTSTQREIIEEMATAILDGILSSPESAVDDTADCDAETVRTAVDLFDPEQ